MPTIELKLPRHRYEVRVEGNALRLLGGWVREVAPHGRAALFVDTAVADTHGPEAMRSLTAAGYDVVMHSVIAGEDHKNLDAVRQLYDVLVGERLERGSPVIALGGGVIGDTVGFVASTYLRGVPFIQCPTTLLAMVDASVGGKVGVNLPQGKNLVGCFYQPRLVVADTGTLGSLPVRELRCGLAECIKHAVIRDQGLFHWLEENLDAVMSLDAQALAELVSRNVAIKAAVVMADERESGERAHLNFGHTFAHAIEATGGYGSAAGYHHGEAVSLGMVAATGLAVDLGCCASGVLDQLVSLLDRAGLPTKSDRLAPTETLIESMRLDKKVAGGRLRLVLPDRIGGVTILDDVPEEAIAKSWGRVRGA